MTRSPLTAPGLLLGVGLGAFVDGIVFHQILQWHHLLSSSGCCSPATTEGLKDHVLADGLFHAAAWLILVGGLVLLWRRLRAGMAFDGTRFAGLLVAGWGLFNVLDGVVNHYVFDLHNVKEGEHARLADALFLAFALMLVALGLVIARARADA